MVFLGIVGTLWKRFDISMGGCFHECIPVFLLLDFHLQTFANMKHCILARCNMKSQIFNRGITQVVILR